jgi:chemotaxis signal transduction protein
VLGVIAVRGRVVTLIDLRRRLALPTAPLGSRTRVLLVDQGEEPLGLLCDRVLQVHRLRESQVELAAVLGAGASSFVLGVGRPEQRKGPADARARVASQDILILLDPIALLKRQVHG